MTMGSEAYSGSQAQDPNRTIRELGFLQRLAQAAATTREPDELFELIIRETTAAMGTDVCSLYFVQPSGELMLTATNGLNEGMVGKVAMRVGEGVTGWVAQTRRPMAVPDVRRDPHWTWVPGLDQEKFRSILSVPIEAGTRLVGALNVQTMEVRFFSRDDEDFLRAIAGQVAGILERSELQRRLEAQLAEIRLSHDIHERFTKLSLDAAGIPAILDAISSLAGGRAILFSTDGYRVRGLADNGDGMPSRLQLPDIILTDHAPRELRITAGRPPRPLDLVPVRAGADLLGVLAVVFPEGVAESQAAEDQGRRRALEHGATVLAVELSKERAAAEVERRLRGDLIEEILAGGLDAVEAERVAKQAERLGHHLPHRAWVVVLEPDDPESETLMSSRGRQDRLDSSVADLVRRRLPGALALTRSASIVVLIPGEISADLAAAEKFAALLQSTVAPVLRPGTASAGVGNQAESVSELPRSHMEARQALRLSRRTGTKGKVISYRSLGAFRLLLEVQSPETLRRFVAEVLGPLLKYAESRETPLLATMEALVAARWVRRQAARTLGIHINSMTYRIERIEALTSLSLDDPETRVALAIALRARNMLGA
ncbi:MAG TPA: GAF domain-containing protein [Candidatus Dormibacteraeota bacterium]|jgi:sugar diacid utilization regulator/putative methionine-R-sulfoxide reductase with GAF domain|nr:GAF domain-containing protein [Candidatus Dormibacteraeota bacterium]